VKRREFISLLTSAAAAWPLPARAQRPSMPVIGFLSSGSGPGTQQMAVFLRGLAEVGFVEGRNITIGHLWAEGRYDRLQEMAAEFVRRQVAVIVAIGPAALAAKTATATIPIVFASTDDPVKLGLVASLARPGGNATGVHFFLSGLGAKQLGLLRELVPTIARIGLLFNPNNENAEALTRELTSAASAAGLQVDAVHARDSREIETAFATLVRGKAGALVVGADPFFYGRRVQLTTLATRHAIPAIYTVREFAEVGGLMSYGTSLTEVFRQCGSYAGRIVKGTKPEELPVVQSTKFELVINVPTARALGLDVPPMLLARADEVIE
jgi:ABC-type uncharacterized transport system substrate-binding protein